MSSEAPIYVIGFPKSGNTWLLRLLCDLCDANADRDDVINAADFRPGRSGTIHKVHFAEAGALEARARIVYIVRDVRDVVVSGFFHNHRFIAEEQVLVRRPAGLTSLLLRAYFRHHVRRLGTRWRGNELAELRNLLAGLRRGKRSGCNRAGGTPGLNWSDHVRYWSSLPGVCLVRYEDLLADPEGELARILRGLGIESPPEGIAAAVARQSFANRKEQFRRQGDLHNERFLRRGAAGDWRRFLDEGLERELVDRNREGLAALSYLGGDAGPEASPVPMAGRLGHEG